ncbi:hypothetical protein BC830DRAFT_1139746 [Chytriomyces sp. MP71]|nr:hypothetical protein BC830DRAFT_1139746 [Chytriomyces sp. MP71]
MTRLLGAALFWLSLLGQYAFRSEQNPPPLRTTLQRLYSLCTLLMTKAMSATRSPQQRSETKPPSSVPVSRSANNA